ILRDAVAELEVDHGRRARADAVVLDERARAEVPQADAPEETAVEVDARARGDDGLEGAGDAPAGRVELREPRPRPSDVGIEGEPRKRPVEIRPLDAVALARARRLGRSRIADEEKLRVELEVPEGQRRDEIRDRGRADAELGALRLYEGIDALDRRAVDGIDANHRAASVVRMEAEAPVPVELGVEPRTDD